MSSSSCCEVKLWVPIFSTDVCAVINHRTAKSRKTVQVYKLEFYCWDIHFFCFSALCECLYSYSFIGNDKCWDAGDGRELFLPPEQFMEPSKSAKDLKSFCRTALWPPKKMMSRVVVVDADQSSWSFGKILQAFHLQVLGFLWSTEKNAFKQ